MVLYRAAYCVCIDRTGSTPTDVLRYGLMVKNNPVKVGFLPTKVTDSNIQDNRGFPILLEPQLPMNW